MQPQSGPSISKLEGSENYKRVKTWFNAFKNHKFKSPKDCCTFDSNKESQYYRLAISDIKGLKPAITNPSNVPAVKLRLTFFNKTSRKVYGRTYESSPLPLVQTQLGYQLKEIANIFYHSKLDFNNDNILIAEVHLVELENGNLPKSEEKHIGFAMMEVYDQTALKDTKTASLIEGTPRELLENELKAKNTLSYNIYFDVIPLPNFKDLLPLLEETELCGFDDILPGLVDRHFPNPQKSDFELPKIKDRNTILFQECEIYVPPELESDIVKSADEYRSKIYLKDEDKSKLSSVYVKNRKLVMVFHNSWTAVNSRQFLNSINLSKVDPNKTIYGFNGSHSCDNIFNDEQALIIFQLEYEMGLPLSGKEQTWNVVIGWNPFFIYGGQTFIDVRENFIRGPGKSVSGEKLYESSVQLQQQIMIAGRLDCSKVKSLPGIVNQPGPSNNIKPSGEPIMKKANGVVSTSDDENMKLRILLQNKEEEMNRLLQKQEENLLQMRRQMEDQMREQRRSRPGSPPNELARTTQSFGVPTADPELKNEVETIKKLLLDLQKQKDSELEELKKIVTMKNETKHFDMNSLTISPSKQIAAIDVEEKPLSTYLKTREISRADKALLIQNGIKGILDNVDDYAGLTYMDEEKAINAEISDKYLASVFYIQFLAFKPAQNAVFRDSIKNIEFSTENFEMPQRVFFTFNFFDFQPTQSQIIVVEKPKTSSSDPSTLTFNIPFYLINEIYAKTGRDSKEPIFKYEVDPSTKSQMNQHIDFAHYLFHKSLTIDIWDADSFLLFGSIKVPLRELLRQGKQTSTVTREYDIIDASFSKSKGSIQILLKNVGRPPTHDMPKNGHTITDKTKQGLNLGKVKVKSKQKINLPEQLKNTKNLISYTDEQLTHPDEIKQARIARFKLASIELNTNTVLSNDDFLKEKAKKELREINAFRETKKMNLLKTVIHQQFNDEKNLNVSFGKVEVIRLELTNYYEYDSDFNIVIEDPDEAYLDRPEFSIISNPSEWKYWIDKKGFTPPPEINLIAINSKNLVLKAGESVDILVKFVTFRGYSDDYLRDLKQGKVDDHDLRRKQFISPRTAYLSVAHSNGRIMNAMKVHISPHSPIIDHTFRFFERAGKNVTLYMPALYHHSAPPTNRPVLRNNHNKVLVEWLNDKEITMQLTVPSDGKEMKFNVVVYNDIYNSELLANWAVEVFPSSGHDISLVVGEVLSYQLRVAATNSRLVRCYSSHPSLVYFPNGAKPIALAPGVDNDINVCVKTVSNKTQSVIVNCVDIERKELVHSWILKLVGSDPRITRRYELIAKCGFESNQKFIFENRTTVPCIYEFTSANPDILQPVDKNVMIEGGQKEGIRVRIGRKDEPCITEVCLFANDADEKLHECLLFQIKYVI